MPVQPDFYKTKSLLEMNEEEWELLCDGCGLCCFRKFITGHGKKTQLWFTRIACNHLNLETGRCENYGERFKVNPECTHLTKRNLPEFKWLPETCAYRLLYEGKPLPQWHPLVSGNAASVKNSGIQIKNAVHESDVDEADWEDYVV